MKNILNHLYALVCMLCSYSLFAAEIIELNVESPSTYCAEIKCFKVASGKVGIYSLQHRKNPLAFATLAERTDFGGIEFVGGDRIRFSDPEYSDYYQSNFSRTYLTAKKLAGITFRAASEVKFSRFNRSWSSPQGMYIFEPLPNNRVTIQGELAESTTTPEGIVLKPNTPIVFSTNVPALSSRSAGMNSLISGTVGLDSIYRNGKTSIEVPAGTQIGISDQYVLIWGEQYLKGLKIEVNAVRYRKDTGAIDFISPSKAVRFNNVLFAAQRYSYGISFYENGHVKRGVPVKAPQLINGMKIDGLAGLNGPLEFYEDGHALALTTTDVGSNRKFLPPELSEGLPDQLHPDAEKVLFLSNPQGALRAIVIVLAPHVGGPGASTNWCLS